MSALSTAILASLPKLAWKLGEATGTGAGTIADATGNGRAGTISDRSRLALAADISYGEGATWLPGSSGVYISQAYDATLDPGTGDFAIAFLYQGGRPSALATDNFESVFERDTNSTGNGIDVYLTGVTSNPGSYPAGSIRVWCAGSVVQDTLDIQDGKPHLVFIERISGTLNIYVDNALRQSVSRPGNASGVNSAIYVGEAMQAGVPTGPSSGYAQRNPTQWVTYWVGRTPTTAERNVIWNAVVRPTSFAYVGAPQAYTVPAGVSALVVDAAGADGAGAGGLGGRVQATLPVTPGEVLHLNVGGAGSSFTGTGNYHDIGRGWNGGGGGGGSDVSNTAYGGGGATDIRRTKFADGFDTNTSGLYTPSSDTDATWTWDTAGSRLTASGGLQSLRLRTGQSLQNFRALIGVGAVDDGGVVFRYVDNGNYYLLAIRDDTGAASLGAGNNFQLYKRVGGTFTALGGWDVVMARGTHIVFLEVEGSTITIKLNGALVGTVTDTTFAAAGGIGLRTGGNPASAVYTDFSVSVLADRILVAGGGGGQAGDGSYGSGSAGSGGPGGQVGGDGVYGGTTYNGVVGSPGLGGTQAAGGAGGAAGLYYWSTPPTYDGEAGTPGTLGRGGDGAYGWYQGGGGGGGGYYGGGGGGAPGKNGGGGGSSYVIPAATGVTHTQGYQAGDGALSLITVVGVTVTTADTAPITSDVAVGTLIRARAVTDSASITDTATGAFVISRSVADSAPTTDALQSAAIRPAVTADDVSGLTDEVEHELFHPIPNPKPDPEEEPTQPEPVPEPPPPPVPVEATPLVASAGVRPALGRAADRPRRPRNAWGSDVPVSRPVGIRPGSGLVPMAGFTFTTSGIAPDLTDADAEELFTAVFEPRGNE